MPLRDDALSRALDDPADPPFHPLPRTAADLLRTLDAPPRLAAHLRAVHDVAPGPARFAATHATWTAPGVTVEDLLVSTADKIWKNKRVPALEDLGAGADRRLAHQAAFPS